MQDNNRIFISIDIYKYVNNCISLIAARNKKDAKKIAAKAALLALYGLNYPEENKTDQSEDVQSV